MQHAIPTPASQEHANAVYIYGSNPGHVALRLKDQYLTHGGGGSEQGDKDKYKVAPRVIPIPVPPKNLDMLSFTQRWFAIWTEGRYNLTGFNCAHSIIYSLHEAGYFDNHSDEKETPAFIQVARKAKEIVTDLNAKIKTAPSTTPYALKVVAQVTDTLLPSTAIDYVYEICLDDAAREYQRIKNNAALDPITKIEKLLSNHIKQLNIEVNKEAFAGKDNKPKKELIQKLEALKNQLADLDLFRLKAAAQAKIATVVNDCLEILTDAFKIQNKVQLVDTYKSAQLTDWIAQLEATLPSYPLLFKIKLLNAEQTLEIAANEIAKNTAQQPEEKKHQIEKIYNDFKNLILFINRIVGIAGIKMETAINGVLDKYIANQLSATQAKHQLIEELRKIAQQLETPPIDEKAAAAKSPPSSNKASKKLNPQLIAIQELLVPYPVPTVNTNMAAALGIAAGAAAKSPISATATTGSSAPATPASIKSPVSAHSVTPTTIGEWTDADDNALEAAIKARMGAPLAVKK